MTKITTTLTENEIKRIFREELKNLISSKFPERKVKKIISHTMYDDINKHLVFMKNTRIKVDRCLDWIVQHKKR